MNSTLTLDSCLINSLSNKTGELGIYCYYYRDSKGRYQTRKYEELPHPYNQLLLIRQSKYYKLNNDVGSSLVFRDGADGLPDIFDISIRTIYNPSHLTSLVDPWEWVNYKGSYPHHCKNSHNSYIEWR